MTAPVTYVPGFLTPPYANYLFEALMRLDWERRSDAPRYEYWTSIFGRSYTYGRGAGRRTYESRPGTDDIMEMREAIFDCTNSVLEGCFLNRYDDSRDHLGWHADDDPGIDHKRGIVVVSLGQERDIAFKPIDGSSPAVRQKLEHGSLLLMHPGMQQTHLHRIPKAAFIAKPRISMTFRGLIA